MITAIALHILARVALVLIAAAALHNASQASPEHRGPQLCIAGLAVLGLVALNAPFVRL